MLLSGKASAKPSLSWTQPVAREDGTALAADEIAAYTIEWKRDAGDPIGGCTTVTSAKSSHNYGFTVKANYTLRIWVTDKNGVSSKPSAWVNYVLR